MTDDERALLIFEEGHPRNDGHKEALIRDELGLRAVRYYQKLMHLVKEPEVIAEFPQMAKRVQRQAAVRARNRAARVTGP